MFVSVDVIDVDAPSLSVDLHNLACFSLRRTTNYSHLVAALNWNVADAVFLTEDVSQSDSHSSATFVGVGREVGFALDSSAARNWLILRP